MTTVLLTAILVWMALGLLFWGGFVLFRLRFECADQPATAKGGESTRVSAAPSERAVGARG